MAADKVFISYSHDSPEHMARVLELSNTLRQMGVDAELDRYQVRPPQGWAQWCADQLDPDISRFVVIVCTANYKARFERKVPADEGRGVAWEGAIIDSDLYEEKGSLRFIPILLGEEPETSVPRLLRQQARYVVKAIALSDEGFEALYRELTDQPKVKKPGLGAVHVFSLGIAATKALETQTLVAPPLAAREVKTTFAPAPEVTAPAGRYDIARISAYAPEALIGREAETAVLVDAWDKAAKGEAHPHVLTFVALGGEGKTSLVASFANDLAARDWPGCEAAFAWSFYRQSSSDQAGASSDLFFAQAFEAFGLTAIERESGYHKGKRLARHLGERRALLILDGLEPLQYAPSQAHNGELKDEGVNALLRGLSGRNAGLCVVTTRYRIADLRGRAAPQHDLASLSDEAGAELLKRLGVKGAKAERRRLSAAVKGHALTLEIVGGYLRDAWGGDIAKRDRVTLKAASAHARDHAFRAMQAYADWFASAGEDGARLLAMLRLTGLFDRPASAGCLGALLRAPVIEGLTEALVDLSEPQRNVTLSRLEKTKLINVARATSGALVEIDAHPLLREYFADEMRKTRPDAWRAAHRRLYEHLATTTPDKEAPTLDDLAPLYQAVTHGCAAGLWDEAREKVYKDRICRGMGPGGFYSTHNLGAFGADLGAIACFFETPWRRTLAHLHENVQALMMNLAGNFLRALGRLDEAREPMRASLDKAVATKSWKNAAIAASSLSQLELTLGVIESAVRYGEESITYADRSRDGFQRVTKRTAEATARHQAGERAAAEALFATAETLNAELHRQYAWLHLFEGYLYCDLKLDAKECTAWRLLLGLAGRVGGRRRAFVAGCTETAKRAANSLALAETLNVPRLIGLDHLTLARAALHDAIFRGKPLTLDHVNGAVDFIRRSGQQDDLPRPLLTRALHRAVTGDFPGAREDLDEAYEIAERGPMRLFLADIHLHRARLFGLLANRPAAYPWTSAKDDLAQARKLIEQCGYGRRLPELQDAEAALRAL